LIIINNINNDNCFWIEKWYAIKYTIFKHLDCSEPTVDFCEYKQDNNKNKIFYEYFLENTKFDILKLTYIRKYTTLKLLKKIM
jgi:hypothetical protein